MISKQFIKFMLVFLLVCRFCHKIDKLAFNWFCDVFVFVF